MRWRRPGTRLTGSSTQSCGVHPGLLTLSTLQNTQTSRQTYSCRRRERGSAQSRCFWCGTPYLIMNEHVAPACVSSAPFVELFLNLLNQGPAGRARVAGEQDYEVDHFAKRLLS